MVYMFNELSLKEANSKQSAQNILETFIRSVILANELGFSEIRLYEKNLQNLYQVPLYKDYRIDHWLKDSEIDSNLQERFRDIVTSFPLITEAEIRENEFYQRSEFHKTINGNRYPVWGLGAAYIYDTISVSLGTDALWNENNVSISHYCISKNDEGENSEVSVKHFSNSENLNVHIEWWQQKQNESLAKSIELWEKREEFFPNIEMCSEVEKQLKNLGVSKMLFQIIERLKELNKYAGQWTEGNFSYKDVNAITNLRISPETERTISMFGSLRKFTVNRQGKKLFDLHIKTGDLRLHLYPDNEARKIYIGYIGKHLRVASDG